MKRLLTLIAPSVAAVVGATTLLALAASSITLYSGAQINARMNSSISSATANVGDRFALTIVPPYPSGNAAFRGAQIQGVVTKVRRAGQGTKPEVDMKLQYLRMADGSVANISGKVTSAQRQASTANNVGKAALGALGGMLVGNAIGKTIFHTSGGGAVGFVGGALLGANNKENFTIPQGSNVQLTLNQTVTIRTQSGY